MCHGGCILRRPCFRTLGSKNATKLRPPHWFWNWVAYNVSSGMPLPHSPNGRNIDRILRAAIKKINAPSFSRYPPWFPTRGTRGAEGIGLAMANRGFRGEMELLVLKGIRRPF